MRKIVVALFVLMPGLTQLYAQKKPGFDLQSSMLRGREIYVARCNTCHGKTGEGVEGVYPPLAKSDFLMTSKKKSAHLIRFGLNGSIRVNGVSYNEEMPPADLTDKELSDVLNYIRNSWGNKGEAVDPEAMRAIQK
jgi:mono/diheme cytochrome c family protein